VGGPRSRLSCLASRRLVMRDVSCQDAYADRHENHATTGKGVSISSDLGRVVTNSPRAPDGARSKQ
jgi:hypothetical protein